VINNRTVGLIAALLACLSILSLLTGIAGPAAAATSAPSTEPATAIDFTARLTQSTGTYQFWTTPPSEKVFKDSPVPLTAASEVKVYAAKNEFEPFQVVVKPASSGSAAVSIASFTGGVSVELYQVKYVNVTTPTDYLGRTGANPDPLWPLENNATVTLTANENTSFWFSLFVGRSVASGDYVSTLTIGGVSIPLRLHVFNFSLPDELHVNSYLDIDFNQIYTRYAAASPDANRLAYRDKIDQFMIDHRVSPRFPMPPGGLTSNGAIPYINYNCATNTFSDPWGVDGFLFPASRYLKGTGFNEGAGFPAWGAAWYKQGAPASGEQRGTLCGQSPSGWMASYPFTPGSFNAKWFQNYIPALRDYLNANGLLAKAYYCTEEEPQGAADYNAIAWYTQELKRVVPDLKLMVAEQPRPEIYANPSYPGAKVDIWDAHFGTSAFDPAVSLDRLQNHAEDTWIYFLYNTYPPRFNPMVIDHPGVEGKLLGWFLWKYRVRGFEYWLFDDWSANPWTSISSENTNGDRFLIYPPTTDNTNLPSYGANNHRFVPSIRFELIRDSLDDYEYFYLLNGASQPQPGLANPADAQVGLIIQGLTAYTRDGDYLYNLRRLIGLKLGGEISAIPTIAPTSKNPRADGAPGNYYINFQDPAGQPTGPVIYNGHTYAKIGNSLYNAGAGYGWYRASDVPQPDFYNAWDQWVDPEPKALLGSAVIDDYGRNDTFEYDLPNGTYRVTAGVGWRGGLYHHYVTINGVPFFTGDVTDHAWISTTRLVTVTTKKLLLEMGKFDEIGILNYLDIEAVNPKQTYLPAVGR
jgi:hypothetical protein